MMTDTTKTERVQLLMSPDEVEAIDEWRWANRIRSRAEAIRHLIGIALAAPLDNAGAKVHLNSRGTHAITEQVARDAALSIPKKWTDPHGPLRIVGAPAEGYVMMRRPSSAPFIVSISALRSGVGYLGKGPFSPVVKERKS